MINYAQIDSLKVQEPENIELEQHRQSEHKQEKKPNTKKIKLFLQEKTGRLILAFIIMILIGVFIFYSDSANIKIDQNPSQQTQLQSQWQSLIVGPSNSQQFTSKQNLVDIDPKQSEESQSLLGEIKQGKINLSNSQKQLVKINLIQTPQIDNSLSSLGQTNLPNILWLITHRHSQALFTYQAIIRNSIKEMGRRSGFQVRVVDTWTAQEYLSPEMKERIRQSMHGKVANVNVLELLRLALLIEHGGVFIEVQEFFLTEHLSWLAEIFEGKEGKLQKYFGCRGLMDPEVFLFTSPGSQPFLDNFRAEIVAARKHSALLREVFEDLARLAHTGIWEYERLTPWVKFDQQMNVTNYEGVLERIIESRMYIAEREQKLVACKHFKLQSLNLTFEFNPGLPGCFASDSKRYTNEPYLIEDKCNQRFFVQPPNSILFKIVQSMKLRSLDFIHPQSFLVKIVFQGDNKEFLKQRKLVRPVNFCVVSLDAAENQKTIKESLFELEKQTFKNWRAVYLVQGRLQSSTSKEKRIQWVRSRGNQGLDAQVVYSKHCPNNSFIFLLHFHERIRGIDGLQRVADELENPNTFGAFISLEYKQRTIVPQNQYNFNREYNYLRNNLKQNNLNELINHFRVFDSRMYRLIPKFQLHRLGGDYYKDRLIYLMAILQLAGPSEIKEWNYVHYELENRKFNFPQRTHLMKKVFVVTQKYEMYDKQQLEQIRYKFPGFSMKYSINFFIEYGRPFSNFYIFNDGEEAPTYKSREGLPKIIPKIIHQIWIKGSLPPVKAYLSKKTQNLYPEYQYRLWKQENLTAENFPSTISILQRLIKFDRQSPYTKLAMMTDLMRGEVLYNNGGFYYDINLEILRKTFEDWLTYKLVMPAEQPFRNRGSAQICFIGCMPKFSPLLRVLLPNNTNRYDIYSARGDIVTGPANYQQIVQGNQQQDPDYLFIPYEYMFSAATNLKIHQDRCIVHGQDTRAVAIQIGVGILPKCEQYYPLQIAIEHYTFGETWRTPRKK